ncbi:A/G-specific adenine glycosylase [Flavobacterium sp. CYK-55]|uniref:A/G-specific adenine glycosylase n=1 Tax=Flavobacterium sp. CYK-55 TaxID=2835529 RepID=UPI001BCAD942|nr:A/G-specific adenine glycosylase [Flavobacterium sp. CYK-55]MBS7785961.1 A/G-specific adenine glycosylase [Flavobacterium sp. CYK-55]
MDFAFQITDWYHQNKRNLPWRNTRNPYHIWLSEIMLQQTRVAQGLPYYYAFTEAFPTVTDLAKAPEERVLKLWQGLGYYSRARNLHQTAQKIAFEFNGQFPESYQELLKLKGIGNYTAAAIASFCFDQKVPVVDGNVYRVLARYFAMDTDIASSGAYKEFFALANELILDENPGLFNQAIMEFGALQCVPKSPNCNQCPLSSGCLAKAKQKVNVLPVKISKTKVQEKHFNYIFFEDDLEQTLLVQRSNSGIWKKLYEFPLIETAEVATEDVIINWLNKSEYQKQWLSVTQLISAEISHRLTHRLLHIKFWKVRIKSQLNNGLSRASALALPTPIVIFNFMNKQWS